MIKKIDDSNIDKYLDKHGHDSNFLLYYYLKDSNKILTNYYIYGKNMTFKEKMLLVNNLLDKVDINIIDTLLTDILAKHYEGNEEEIDKILNYLLEEDKNNKINIDDIIIKDIIYELDPIYAIKKNINNIAGIRKKYDKKIVLEILKYASYNKYVFTNKDKYLITENILKDEKLLIYFINNCEHDLVFEILCQYFNKLSNSKLHSIYYKINDNNIKSGIIRKNNFNNFNVTSIIKEANIYLKTDNNEAKVLEFLKQAKIRNIDSMIILIMNRVNLSFVKSAFKIYGNNLRISPMENQERKLIFEDNWDMPYYTYRVINNCEKKLDMYVNCTLDKNSKSGKIKRLSPFEKYIAAYIMTIKFKHYKLEKNIKDYHISRSVYELIKSNKNKKMVCVGYVHLFKEFLYRMDIKDNYDWDVHIPNDEEDNDEINHLRMIIHLIDSKYDIDGIYMSDPTWDEKGLLNTTFKHMVMSLNELNKIDDLSLSDLMLDDFDKLEELFKLDNVEELFNKPISKDKIIRASLALEHFLDLEMEMVNDSEYTKEEYELMEEKLGYNQEKVLKIN